MGINLAAQTMMPPEQHQVRAEYLGYIDLGAAAFAVPLTDIKPESKCANKIIFRSRIGDEFVIGQTYDVLAKISGEPRDFDVIALI